MAAARRANLDKGKLALIARMFLEQPFHRQKSLQNSFRIVHAVHADTEQCRLESRSSNIAERSIVSRFFGSDSGVPIGKSTLIGNGRTGVCGRVGSPKSVPNRSRDSKTRSADLQEVVTVRLDVESDEVGAEQPVQQFASATDKCQRLRESGHGMCQKIATRASGRVCLTILGNNAKW